MNNRDVQRYYMLRAQRDLLDEIDDEAFNEDSDATFPKWFDAKRAKVEQELDKVRADLAGKYEL